MIDPHYRNAIFATQNLKAVKFSVTVDLPENLLKKEYITAGIKLPSGKILMQKKIKAQKELLFEFPVAELPEEKMLIFVKTSSQEVTCRLRKLPYKPSEVWRGKCGNWFRNGKKIFINSGWVRSYTPAYNILPVFHLYS